MVYHSLVLHMYYSYNLQKSVSFCFCDCIKLFWGHILTWAFFGIAYVLWFFIIWLGHIQIIWYRPFSFLIYNGERNIAGLIWNMLLYFWQLLLPNSLRNKQNTSTSNVPVWKAGAVFKVYAFEGWIAKVLLKTTLRLK